MKLKIILFILFLIFAGVFMKNAGAEDKNKITIFNAEAGKTEEVKRVIKSDAEWKKVLTPEQYRITRQKGTEAPFTGKCEIGKAGGIYKCVCCGTDLFKVDEKFENRPVLVAGSVWEKDEAILLAACPARSPI